MRQAGEIGRYGGIGPEGVRKFCLRWEGRWQRFVARNFARRDITFSTPTPLISFTFDDFPKSALTTGGAILGRFGLRATYYACLGLMGRQNRTGPIFSR